MKLRPIPLMAVLLVVVALVAGLVAWHHRSGSLAAGRPGELPIRAEVAGPVAAALAPAAGSGDVAGPVVYVAGADLPALAGTAHAWRLEPTPVTATAVSRLATALGLSGVAITQSQGWTVTGSDGRQLVVTRSQPGGPWTWTVVGVAAGGSPVVCRPPAAPQPGPAIRPTISSGSASRSAGSDVVAPSAATPAIGTVEGCVALPVTTVPDVHPGATDVAPPGSAPAESRARTMLDAAGYDLAGWTLSASTAGDATTVTAAPDLDGVALDSSGSGSGSATLSLSFGPDGQVQSGWGAWVQPVERDAYPLLGTAAAIGALNQGRGLPGVEPMTAETTPTSQTTGTSAVISRPACATPDEARTGQVPSCAPSVTTTLPATANGPELAPPSTVDCAVLAGPAPSCAPMMSTTTSTATGSSNGASPPASEPPVSAPPPVTAPVTVTMAPRRVQLDRAEVVLEAMVGTDGTTWLVPAYRFTSSATPGTWLVLAIDEKWFDPGTDAGSATTGTGTGTGTADGGSAGSTPGSSVVAPATTRVVPPATPGIESTGTAIPITAKDPRG